MELLLILTYAAICVAVFKIFRIPVNKWTLPTAALGGIVMNLNFHLANGSAHPWLIPGDGFDEGVDLDSFMPAVQLVLVIVSAVVWRAMRRRITATDRLLRGVANLPSNRRAGPVRSTL